MLDSEMKCSGLPESKNDVDCEGKIGVLNCEVAVVCNLLFIVRCNLINYSALVHYSRVQVRNAVSRQTTLKKTSYT